MVGVLPSAPTKCNVQIQVFALHQLHLQCPDRDITCSVVTTGGLGT